MADATTAEAALDLPGLDRILRARDPNIANAVQRAISEEFGEAVANGPEPDRARSMSDILADPDALRPPKLIAPRLAWSGCVTLLAGREKRGKTTKATAAGAAVSAGTRWLGEPTTRGHVLWVAPEEALVHVVQRFQAHRADPERVWILQRVPDPLESLAREVERVAPALVVVDTLASWAGPDAPESGDARGWTALLLPLVHLARDTDAAFLLLHHANRERGTYRDSSAIGALVDVLLEMSEGQDGERKIKARARWAVDDYAVRLVGTDQRPRFELAEGELSVETRVLLHVERAPGAGTKEILEKVGGRWSEAREALDRLEARGAIQNCGKGARHEWYPGNGTTEEGLPGETRKATGRSGGGNASGNGDDSEALPGGSPYGGEPPVGNARPSESDGNPDAARF